MYQVLLVEDDKKIREIISDYIGQKGRNEISLTLAKDGREGRSELDIKEFDLVLLDVMLPDTDGFSLCREIRGHNTVPIIFLTARGREEDVLWGYGLGCDDYIVKPFSLATLYAKILAILRRTKGLSMDNVLTLGKISMNFSACRVFVEDDEKGTSEQREILLQSKQYDLLRYLMMHAGMVASRDTLLDRIWGYDYMGTDRIVDNQIKNLRKALGTAGKQIKTIVKKGYKIEEQ